MSSFARFALEVGEDANSLSNKLNLNANDPAKSIQSIAKYFEGLAAHVSYGANMFVVLNAVRATGTITFTGAPSNDETLTINGVTFTAKTSGADYTANEFDIGGSVTATAENLVSAVNQSTSANIKNTVKAANAAGVVTITSLVPGTIGNLMTLTESMANTAVSGANLTGGTEGTDVQLSAGLPAETTA